MTFVRVVDQRNYLGTVQNQSEASDHKGWERGRGKTNRSFVDLGMDNALGSWSLFHEVLSFDDKCFEDTSR